MRKYKLILVAVICSMLMILSSCTKQEEVVLDERFIEYTNDESEINGEKTIAYYYYYNVEEFGYPTETEINDFINSVFTKYEKDSEKGTLQVYVNDSDENTAAKADIAQGEKTGDEVYINYVYEEVYNMNK